MQTGPLPPQGDDDTPPEHHFTHVLQARLGRRGWLQLGAASAASALMGSLAEPAQAASPRRITALGFQAVPKSLADAVSVPPGYRAQVLYRCGDPIVSGLPAFANDGTDSGFEQRAGDCHDGIEYFGLRADGRGPDPRNSERALLGLNHEYQNALFLHPHGPGKRPRSAAEVDKEMAVHGLSIIEVQRRQGRFEVVLDSPFNRRITASTPMQLTGPAAGHALMVTKHSPDGTATRGTQNNCGTGTTPWGTLLTCEENWMGYFTRAAGDDTARGGPDAPRVRALRRYGSTAGTPGWCGWDTAGPEDRFARWDASQRGTSADGHDDYRNVTHTFGWVVEIDPYDPHAPIAKRTALGRFAHETASCSNPVPGQPLAFYMGDDSRNEYIYKFVTDAVWDPADAQPADRMATGSKYLDHGRLYAARFDADGSGQWLPLDIEATAVRGATVYPFADQADVLVHARLAADAAGATPMDRPEWAAVNPANGEVYVSLTNNSARAPQAGAGKPATDAANPRAYRAAKPGGGTQTGNLNGHIIRLSENRGRADATQFRWDVYLFGARADADRAQVNLSGLTPDQDFSSPDGLRFSRATGLAWIETDDGAYTDVTNCMLLAGVPGRVGDGGPATVDNQVGDARSRVTTQVGRRPSAAQLRRFLVGPPGCEITGLCETPDGRALFINIQHPGEGTPAADVNQPTTYQSHWPDGGLARPRSATIVVTKDDGGLIGS